MVMKDGQDNDGDDHHAEMAQARITMDSEAVWPAGPKWYPSPGHPGSRPMDNPRWANSFGPKQSDFPWPSFAPKPSVIDPYCAYPWPDGGVDLWGPTLEEDLKKMPIPHFTHGTSRFSPPPREVPLMDKLLP